MKNANNEIENGFLTGLLGTVVYENLPKQNQAQWKKDFPIHHGEAGAILFALGLLSEDRRDKEFMFGLGLSLMFTDIKDAPKWFRE